VEAPARTARPSRPPSRGLRRRTCATSSPRSQAFSRAGGAVSGATSKEPRKNERWQCWSRTSSRNKRQCVDLEGFRVIRPRGRAGPDPPSRTGADSPSRGRWSEAGQGPWPGSARGCLPAQARGPRSRDSCTERSVQ
jgi:hypothetical protein